MSHPKSLSALPSPCVSHSSCLARDYILVDRKDGFCKMIAHRIKTLLHELHALGHPRVQSFASFIATMLANNLMPEIVKHFHLLIRALYLVHEVMSP
jgi:hypothetical protein